MKTPRRRVARLLLPALVLVAGSVALAGCAGEVSGVDVAQARVAAKEKAVAEAEEDFAAASAEFCGASRAYITALDRYGDVITSTAPTVGDVRDGGADLAEPRDDALQGAQAAVEAQQALVTAEQELAVAQTALAAAEAEASGAAAPEAGDEPDEPSAQGSATPLAPAATVDRVRQAEEQFAQAQAGISDDTPLTEASEQFNSAAVALEMAWIRLFVDAGCLTDERRLEAEEAARAYTAALQQDLTTAGYYTGAVDGIYGPLTVQAVEELQKASGLPVTGTVDKATAEALQAALAAAGGAAADASLASTAAIQQTLKLLGFWDGPVDGVWTPELTEAVKACQVELGVEPTGTVDAATVAAFQRAVADLTESLASPDPDEPQPEPSPEESESTDE
ncbi:peptidoglycan-binding domain-containing protein [Microbacterium sp. BK668]|uniref:peptidoglycan-binding domain-containing protein n=1 Tax=Microbacterium sp. BK668 TaxID=2512118 RepID=UPI0010D353A8|nr:peptidoglycan-binding domain-containing protein [Microbacterium sp. BK668]TDN90713.1 peptidoglycan hydrolase-like protein with peptidoglycan-binding domain [Microbacterium sp. BK668]